jgi:hypothetical protein
METRQILGVEHESFWFHPSFSTSMAHIDPLKPESILDRPKIGTQPLLEYLAESGREGCALPIPLSKMPIIFCNRLNM